jgi:hypothetical protein
VFIPVPNLSITIFPDIDGANVSAADAAGWKRELGELATNPKNNSK